MPPPPFREHLIKVGEARKRGSKEERNRKRDIQKFSFSWLIVIGDWWRGVLRTNFKKIAAKNAKRREGRKNKSEIALLEARSTKARDAGALYRNKIQKLKIQNNNILPPEAAISVSVIWIWVIGICFEFRVSDFGFSFFFSSLTIHHSPLHQWPLTNWKETGACVAALCECATPQTPAS